MIGMLIKFPEGHLVFSSNNGQHLHLSSNFEVTFMASDVSGDMDMRGSSYATFLNIILPASLYFRRQLKITYCIQTKLD